MATYRRDLTDEQLLALAGWVARLYLEAERGHRPPEALRPYAARHLISRLRQTPRSRTAERLSATDVRARQLNRIAADRAYATVVVREEPTTLTAVSMQLRRTPTGTWQVTDLIRLRPRRRPQPRAARRTPPAGACERLQPPAQGPADAPG